MNKNTLDFQELSVNDYCDTARIAKHFKQLYNDKFVYVQNQLYYFNNFYWVKDNKKVSYLNNFISSDYYAYLNELANKLSSNNAKETNSSVKLDVDAKILVIRQRISNLLNHRKRKDYIEDILCSITNDDLKFDENPYLFAFKNKVFDLQKNKFVKPTPEQYISYTTGYDYEKPSKEYENENELNIFIDSIFPQQDLKHLYLTILATGLEGKNLEKFVIANGGGGNGKGVINEFTKHVFGDYCYVMPSNVLLAPLKTGSNPEVANMNNRRLVFCREPDTSNKINSSTMKELTGGEEINARLNHSNNTQTLLKCTLILECNEKPKMNEVNDAVARRIINIPFKSTFVEQQVFDKLKEDQKHNICIVNPYYKSKEFKEKYKLAMFHILVNKYNEYITNNSKLPITNEVFKRNKEYLQSSDDIGEFINDSCKRNQVLNAKGNIKHRIKIKELFEKFKKTDTYNNYDRKEKQILTSKYFHKKLEANIFLRYSVIKNSREIFELVGYEWKSEFDEENEEEEKSPLDN